MKNIIESQIQFLKTHPHIKKAYSFGVLSKSSDKLIQSIKSPYSNSQYRIKIQLSTKYPQEPPAIRFVDPIDHINICPKTGQIAMPILKQDWSPYISPYILMDLIDNLLVQPQLSPEYMIGAQKSVIKSNYSTINLDKRMNNKGKTDNIGSNQKNYNHMNRNQSQQQGGFEKIKSFDSIIMQANKLSNDQMAFIEDSSKPITSMKKKLKRLKTIALEKADNQPDIHSIEPVASPRSPNFPQTPKYRQLNANFNTTESPSTVKQLQQPSSPRSPKTPFFSISGLKALKKNTLRNQTLQNIYEEQHISINSRIEQKTLKTQMKPVANNLASRKQVKQLMLSKHIFPIKQQKHNIKDSTSSLIKGQNPKPSDVFGNMPTLRKNSSQNLIESLKQTIDLQSSSESITKLNKLITFITKEYLELQKKKQSMKNVCLIKILNSKIEQHLQMLEQLQSLSMKVKRNMIKKLKNQIVC